MTNAPSIPRQQGQFLVEAAAAQKTADATGSLISLIRFPAGDNNHVVVVAGGEPPRTLPITASRQQIVAEALGTLQAAQGDPEGYPVTAPPSAVYAEILYDLGSHADALDSYLGGQLRYTEIHTDGATQVTIAVDGQDGTHGEITLSLTSAEPPVSLAYALVELLRAPTPAAPPACGILVAVTTNRA